MELGSLRTFNSSVTPSDSRDFFTYTAAKLCILHPAPERERLLTFQVGKHETEMGGVGVVQKDGSHTLWMGVKTGSNLSAKWLSNRDPNFKYICPLFQ